AEDRDVHVGDREIDVALDARNRHQPGCVHARILDLARDQLGERVAQSALDLGLAAGGGADFDSSLHPAGTHLVVSRSARGAPCQSSPCALTSCRSCTRSATPRSSTNARIDATASSALSRLGCTSENARSARCQVSCAPTSFTTRWNFCCTRSTTR